MDVATVRSGVSDVLIQNQTNKLAEIAKARRAGKSDANNAAKIDETAKEFEAVFLSQMLEQMFSEIDLNPMGSEEGSADDIYKSMLVEEYGKSLSRAGGIGVANHVKREMLRMQEVE